MPRTDIKLRLNERMVDADLKDVRHAVYEYLVEHEADPTHLKSNEATIAGLLPHLMMQNKVWKGLTNNPNWKASRTYSHLKEYLGNLVRKKGKHLA